MATITSTPTATTLSVSGNTAVSGSISWSLPDIPSDATVESRILTGTVNVSMSRGACNSITVNGTSVTTTSGSTFEINLGANSTTTSVTTSATGNNRNATGTVTFTNLIYTVTYKIPVEAIKNLYFGNTTIDNIYIGNTKIVQICIGDNVIYIV